MARVTALTDGALAELLPESHLTRVAGMYLDAPWAQATRKLGPITYTSSVIDDGEVSLACG